MRYTIANLTTDEHGAKRAGAYRDISPEDAEALDLNEFRGAADLPDGAEFADGLDANGRAVRVVRESD